MGRFSKMHLVSHQVGSITFILLMKKLILNRLISCQESLQLTKMEQELKSTLFESNGQVCSTRLCLEKQVIKHS